MLFSAVFKCLMVLFSTVMRSKNMRNSSFELIQYNTCCEIMILKFQLRQAPFVCILCHVLQKYYQWNTWNILSIIYMGICHEH